MLAIWVDIVLCALVGVSLVGTGVPHLRRTGAFLVGLSVFAGGVTSAIMLWWPQ
jgi:hypothetical protein